MRTVLRRALALLRVGYAYMTAYRAELILWALANSLSFILMGVWHQAASRGSFALAPVDVVRYFLTVFVVRQLTVVWVIWEVEQQVVQGRLAPQLLLPIDPGWRHLMNHVAERFARLPFSVLLVILFFAIYPTALWVPSPSALLVFLGLSLGAFLLRFIIQYTIAMGCFWTERASSLEAISFMFYMFFGGAIAPLEFFPELARAMLMMTPFPYMIWMPCRVLLGGVPAEDIVRAFLVMGAWGAFFFLVNRMLWRAGLRRFSAMGA